jgi:glycerol-3-phosphate dehydrogenase
MLTYLTPGSAATRPGVTVSGANTHFRRPPSRSLPSGHWDVLVIGGGITGAGILRELSSAGLRVLLVEQKDFASGTSSRSSKLIHGGLQYLGRLQVGLAWKAVRERERLLRSG